MSNRGWFRGHFIPDEEEFKRNVDCIINNPANWKDDEFC